MKIINLNPSHLTQNGLCATIGIFEGVHLAHRALIKKCQEEAIKQHLASCVITFNVMTSLDKSINKIPLFNDEEKIKQLSSLGIDQLIIIDLDEDFKHTSHQDFMLSLIELGVKHLVVGFDFSYGYKHLGSIETIIDDSMGQISLTIIDKKMLNGAKIGTTQIKEYLLNGLITKANQLLGFPYYIKLHNGNAPQLSLLKNGTYHVLIDNHQNILSILDGQISTPQVSQNALITFINEQE